MRCCFFSWSYSNSKARTKHLSHDFNLQCSLISWFVFPWNGIRSESTHSECNEFVNYSDKSVLIYLFRDQSSLKYRKIVAWSNLDFSSSSTKTDAWTPQYNYWYRKWFHWFAPRNMVMCWIFEWTSENIRHNEKHKTVRLVSGFLCLHVG